MDEYFAFAHIWFRVSNFFFISEWHQIHESVEKKSFFSEFFFNSALLFVGVCSILYILAAYFLRIYDSFSFISPEIFGFPRSISFLRKSLSSPNLFFS